jgi:hypothetical protein
MDTLVLQAKPTQAQEAENAMTLASTHEDADGLVLKVALVIEPHQK